MSPRSCSSFSSKLLLVITCALCGCSDLIDSGGSTDSSSKSACSGDGGLVPSPVAPQGMVDFPKYAIPQKAYTRSAVLPRNTALTAIVDEECVLSQPAGGPFLSQMLRPEIEQQPSLSRTRAYSLRTPVPFKSDEVLERVIQDSCLINVSEEAQAWPTATTDDPQLNLLLHLDNIEAFTAWDTLHNGLTGNTVIAIIDDGMQMNHPDLQDMLWTNPDEIAANGVDDDGNGYVDDVNGYNFAANTGSPAHQGSSVHGTHVAGLAAAEGNNGVGVTGVMGRNAQIMVLNVFGTAASTSSTRIINAINYARTKGAHVINMSLGGSGTASSVNTAMVNAVAAGTFVVSAAGNDNREITASAMYMPGGYSKDIDGAVAVGSIDAVSSLKSSFSNYGPTYVEISAPGSNSATGGLRSTYPGSTYAYMQGTSMASPVVAGAAALVIGWARAQGLSPTPAQIEDLIKDAAESSNILTTYFLNGGKLNLANMAQSAQCSL